MNPLNECITQRPWILHPQDTLPWFKMADKTYKHTILSLLKDKLKVAVIQ